MASDLGARIWRRRAPTGMRTTPIVPSFTRRTQSDATGTYSINQKTSRKMVVSASTTYTDVCVGNPGSAGSNPFKYSRTRDGVRRSKAVPGQVEDAIASPVDIPSSIACYQKMLQYASIPLDYVFGIGLYLAPSNMAEQCPGLQQRNRNRDCWI